MVDRGVTSAGARPAHPERWLRLPALGLAAVLLLARTGGVAAFPLLDTITGQPVPQGTELEGPAAQDLQHQLRLVNGLGAPAGGGWTFVPRIDWQEGLTDNVLQVHSPRDADLVTYVAPGIGIAGDLPRVKMTFDFAPTLALYARTSDLNALTEQMNGLGNVTLVPDLAYVDVRAVAGVHNLYGGLGGLGALGSPAGAAATPQTAIPTLAGNGVGLNRNNEVQTTSVGISPYLLRRFGDWGTGRLGDSFNVSRSETLPGFAASPIPTGGANGQTLVSNEESAHFVTGDFLQFFRDSFDVDLIQSQTTTDANGATLANGLPAQAGVFTSSRMIVTDQVNYALTRTLNVFASGGHEDITYSNQSAQSITGVTYTTGANGQPVPNYTFGNTGPPSIHDLTWSLGATWTPNPDSSLTVSYGHLDGFNSFTANGHYALTPRTMLTVSYGSTLGTQLENVQNQLSLAGTNGTGTLVNGLTGGSLFGGTNALSVEDGVFRITTLAVGSTTTLDRDIISISLLMAKQTSAGGSNGASLDSKTVNLSWLHQMRPDMTVSAALSYAIEDQGAGALPASNPGDSTSIAAGVAWQWQLSDTLSASLRYSFFERQSSVTIYQLSENLIILGISKRF